MVVPSTLSHCPVTKLVRALTDDFVLSKLGPVFQN